MAKDNKTSVGSNADIGSLTFNVSELDTDALAKQGCVIHGADLLKLGEMEGVKGIYLGVSKSEGTNPATGEVKAFNVYELEPKPGKKVRLTATVQLDDAFSKIKVGTMVTVARYTDKTTGNRRKMQDMRVIEHPTESRALTAV